MTRRDEQDSTDRHREDARLVGLCLEGDAAAWDELLRRHRPLILAVAHRNGMRGQDAEDIYQATCLTMLERLELLKDHVSLAAWVATTTARKCWRAGRRQGRDVPSELATSAPVADSPSPAEEFAAAAERDAVRRAHERLGEPCRTLLALLFMEERPYAEIADRLGLSIGSIGVYRRRCLDRLRGELEQDGWRFAEREGGGVDEPR